MAIVDKTSIGTLNNGLAINVDIPITVQNGKDGSFAVAANQIAWGNSEFNGSTFGGTSQGLLTAIEDKIGGIATDILADESVKEAIQATAQEVINETLDGADLTTDFATSAPTEVPSEYFLTGIIIEKNPSADAGVNDFIYSYSYAKMSVPTAEEYWAVYPVLVDPIDPDNGTTEAPVDNGSTEQPTDTPQ